MEKTETNTSPKGTGNEYSESEFVRKVREHKHNYSQDFGNVVCTPAIKLFESLINYPELYTDVGERERIIDAFKKAIRTKAIYDQIGLKLDEQLNRLNQDVISVIRENAAFFQDVLLNHKDLSDILIKRLMFSLNRTDELCHKLENLESQEYGVAEDFVLRYEILNAFRQDNNYTRIEGKKRSIQVFTDFGKYADAKTHMPKDVFVTHVIGNIISNFHKYAFTNEKPIEKVVPMVEERRASQLIFPWFWGSPKVEYVHVKVMKEKQVQIEFKKDDSRPNRLNIFISNNGTPFYGETKTVFDYGVGTGSGIGLYSAKCFLNKYDADIKMESTPDEEYTVSFIINLPILSI